VLHAGAQRHLAAIFAADVAGYSRLIGFDEEGTVARLKATHRELIAPLLEEHRGRVVRTAGDGMLVEFASAVEAVQCAIELQRALLDRNVDVPLDERILFRIGINVGDVIEDDGDLFGDGVNVAARLEALAEPGGVCISRAVRDQIRDKLPFAFDDRGEFQVKNIARPVRVYALGTAGLGRESKTSRRPAMFENVPARVLNFTGRENILAELNRILIEGDGKPFAQVAIHGLGGIGKTSVATEYAHRYAGEYAGVWWAPAENRTLLVNSLAALAGQLVPSLSQEVDQERGARAGLAHISRSPTPFLLIYDNVETPDVLRGLLPSAGARLLITTRWADWGGRSAELSLDVLGPESAVELLQNRAERNDLPGAARLAAALGCLPLALDHAGAYCRLTGTTFETYQEKIDRLLARPPKGAPYPASVGATFDLAIEKAAGECPGAEALLGFCAFLAPERIPLDLIPTDLPGEEDRAEALLTLAAVSLVEHAKLDSGEPALRTHRLVQLAMRRRLAENGSASAMSARVTRRMAEVFPKTAYRDTSVWPRCTVLLPHVIAMRDRLADAPGDPNLAGFLEAAGSYLHRRGAYGEAEPFLKRAMTAAEETLGREHPELAAARSSLAHLYRDIGRNAEAEPLFKEALAITEKALGRDHAAFIARLNDLAHLYYDTGRHSEAEPILKEAIAVGEKALGREHSSVAIALGSLARLCRAAGRHAEAEPLFGAAIDAGQKALGREHPAVARALGYLRGDRVASHRDSTTQPSPNPRRLDGEEFSREHPDVAIQLNNLAYLYRAAGRLAEAEPLLKEALAITERALGREHPDIAISLNSLARLYRESGRYGEATSALKEAISISENMVGREHPAVAIRLYNLGRLYSDMGSYNEAEAVLKEVIAISEKTMGRGNQATARARWAYANVLLSMQRNEEALEQAAAATVIHEKVLGAQHQWTADSAQACAAALRVLGRGAEADELMTRLAPALDRDHSPSGSR
jgi:class 3 adenylate cyclase/tetratricopeptide (TPR) repeat protein